VLLDNCSVHKALDDVFVAKGYDAMFLPPYSPRFNPVEMAFSKIKQKLRSMWPWDGGLDAAIETSVRSLTPSDLDAFFRHSSQEGAETL
jgi:hypothetical protein